ncbi:hypothetical protein AB5J72_41795 [Streptomyces sp. CG1]|uniref:hypothetical protein n=1 Tax=Streptomyces sp. CG1 TaxID=1287523 RepID=UPI0034E1CC50
MSDTLYGLAGALGGSLIAGVAAYWGPLQAQRHALARSREEGEQNRRDAEALRVRVEQREVEERARVRREAATERIIRVRTTTRAWSQLLERYLQDLRHGRSVSVSEFDAAVHAARTEAHSAIDSAMDDGLRVLLPQTRGHSRYRQPEFGFDELHRTHVRPELQSTTVALNDAMSLMREAILGGGAVPQDRIEELQVALAEADDARHELTLFLMDRLERIVVPDPHS